jgi:hypothetical protein
MSRPDALAHEWSGRVWVNPPYSKIDEFVAKLLKEVEAGRVTAAILLTNDCTDAQWFHQAVSACSAFCLTRGRIRFEREDGPADSPPRGQTFFYFGNDAATFRNVFRSIGFVAQA